MIDCANTAAHAKDFFGRDHVRHSVYPIHQPLKDGARVITLSVGARSAVVRLLIKAKKLRS